MKKIKENFPKLIPGLSQHPGISFIMVHSEENGPIVVGAEGTHYLKTGKVDGKDPLTNFGPNASQHLKRSDTFPHVPDILVNSLYYPEKEEVAAFEELVGSHGGLGGHQTQPFIMCPSDWKIPNEKIVGASSVYSLLKGWINQFSS